MIRRVWDSPFSALDVTAAACQLAEPQMRGTSLYWLQSLPAEEGRVSVMTAAAGSAPRSLVAAPLSVRSRVNEYGGGAYTLAPDALWFVNDEDQSLWQAGPTGRRRVFGRADLALGDLAWDERHRRVLAVAEDRSGAGSQCLLAIDEGGGSSILAAGADFYGAPRPSPDGRSLLWLEWSTPDMPWDATRLMAAEITATAALANVRRLAGGYGESLVQPEWGPDGRPWVASDGSGGFWNLHRLGDEGLRPVRSVAAECARPAFVFAQRLYAFAPDGALLLAEAERGLWRCLEGRPGSEMRPILAGLSEITGLAAGDAGVAVIGGAADSPMTLWVRWAGESAFRRLVSGLDCPLDPEFFGGVTPLAFDGSEGTNTHGLYFPPANPDHGNGKAVALRVRCHGGPTSAASSALEATTLYWTSRGFGILELNYRGSSGYGRAYREAIYGQWGVADVADAHAAARGLVAAGLADAGALVIAGGSAGGLTVLNALMGASPYAAGASYYGVSDLTRLVAHTHRFEAGYGERLLGAWPAMRDRYRDRSPLARVDEITRPVIFFQGLDDPVVPPAQSERMAAALAARGIAVVYERFAGERHGFRRPASIARALAAELGFHARVLGLHAAPV